MPAPLQLYNSEILDAVPAELVQPRRLQQARLASSSSLVVRHKDDGRHLAWLRSAPGRFELLPAGRPLGRLRADLQAMLALLGLTVTGWRERGPIRLQPLPPRHLAGPRPDHDWLDLARRLDELGLSALEYAERSGLELHLEPAWLLYAGRDRYRRPVWLLAAAAEAWQRMRRAAADDGIALEVISAFRSHAYQHAIIRRKLARGQTLDAILQVNAAPGFSEHHSGRALDLSCPGEPAAEPSFDATAAFDWLRRRAAEFGFSLSYPRDNPHGIVYEPWHWCWHS